MSAPTREEVARLFRTWQDIERKYGWGSPQEMAARDAHGAASRSCAEHEERNPPGVDAVSLVDVEVIRHCVGADGTMRYRFTFNVSVDPAAVTSGGALRDEIARVISAAVTDARSRFQAFGTSREDGMPLPPVEAAQVDHRAAAFDAGYIAGWNASSEGHNSEFTHATDDALDEAAKAALDAYLAESAK